MQNDQKKVPIALQLFSVHGECSWDFPATLKSVAEIGYVGAELWGYSGDVVELMGYEAKTLRGLFDDNNLKCCGMHLSTSALLGDNLDRTIELNQILGNRFLIIAFDDKRMSNLDTIMELAGILNNAAEKLQPLDMLTGYHGHPSDFVRFGDETAWEILFSNTREDVVMQLDIGNCVDGDGDPIAMLMKFPGRARSVHLKEYGGGPVIGEGKADWDEIFRLCDTLHHPEWYVVEAVGQGGQGFDISERSLKNLRAMGK